MLFTNTDSAGGGYHSDQCIHDEIPLYSSSKRNQLLLTRKEQVAQANPDTIPQFIELETVNGARDVKLGLQQLLDRPQLAADTAKLRSERIKNNLFHLLIRKLYMNKFVGNLMKFTYTTKLKNLPSQIRVLLADNIYDGDQRAYSVPMQQSRYLPNRISDFTSPMLPQSRTLLMWDYLQISIMLFLFFHIPLCISFQLQEEMSTRVLITIFIGLGNVIKLNVAYIERGSIITDRKQILNRYMKTELMMDAAALGLMIVYYFVLMHSDVVWDIAIAGFMFLMFLKRITVIEEKVQEHFNLQGSIRDLLSIVQMIVLVLLIAHLMACLWHGVGVFQPGTTWLEYYELDHETLTTKYNYSFYWATMTMTTVGYGDILPQNNIERGIASLVMFVSGGVLSFIVSNIGTVLSHINSTKQLYERTLNLINDFMMRNKVRFDLQLRIRSYLQYIYKEQNTAKAQDVDEVLTQLNSALKNELLFQVKGNHLKQCRVMSRFSDRLLTKLASQMQELRYTPEEPILSDSETTQISLYIIIRGEMLVSHINKARLSHLDKHIIAQLKKGDSFGEWSFFTGLPPQENIYSLGFSKLYQITREDFLELIEGYPKDYETYCYIRDQLLIHRDLSIIYKKCYACQKRTHSIKHCPLLHYQPNRERVLKKYLFPVQQGRGGRFTRPRGKCRPSLQQLQQQVVQFRREIDEEADEEKQSLDSEDRGALQDMLQLRSFAQAEEMKPDPQQETGQAARNSPLERHKRLLQLSRFVGEKRVNQVQHPDPQNLHLEVAEQQPYTEFDLEQGLDRMNSFSTYYPRYNFEAAIARVNVSNRMGIHHEVLMKRLLSPYSFNFYVASKALRYKFISQINRQALKQAKQPHGQRLWKSATTYAPSRKKITSTDAKMTLI